MKKIIKIGLIVLFFVCAASDLFSYTEFQPEQLEPSTHVTGVYSNQIFAYGSTTFKGYFLNCSGAPTVEYAEKGPVVLESQEVDKIKIVYPKKNFGIGELIKTGFTVSCDLGLVFLDPNLSFHLFNTSYYPARYVIESKTLSRDEFVDLLHKISPNFKVPDNY